MSFGCTDCSFTGWVPTQALEVPQEDGRTLSYDQVRGCPRCRPLWSHPDERPEENEDTPRGYWQDR